MFIAASSSSAKTKRQSRSHWTGWLKPHCAASAGTAQAMERVMDDPDVPCYPTNAWTKADKNRFHQERAPGGPKKYVMNPNLWCHKFWESLTAVSIANEYSYPGNTVPNEGWMCKRGAIAITPQHIGSCGHAPVGISIPEYPSIVRFIGKDGETYDRAVVGQKYCINTYKVLVNGVLHSWDSWVGTLDEPLPAAVHIARTIPNHFKFTGSYGAWDNLFVTQSSEAEAVLSIGTQRQPRLWSPYNDPGYSFATSHTFHPQYPTYHRTMAVPNAWFSGYGQQFLYHLWGGDSGMPLFYAYGTELLWAGFAGGGGVGPNGYPTVTEGVTITWEDLVSAMIDDSDDDAIARGYLSSRTGRRCVFANEVPDMLPP
jgi:hypothetical protein